MAPIFGLGEPGRSRPQGDGRRRARRAADVVDTERIGSTTWFADPSARRFRQPAASLRSAASTTSRHARGLVALVDAAPAAAADNLVPVAALFDHEEVGSR